jgi:hypothetical protein
MTGTCPRNVVLTCQGDDKTITVGRPRNGLHRGGWIVLLLSVCWFSGTVALGWAVLDDIGGFSPFIGSEIAGLLVYVFIGSFLTAGLFIALAAINMGHSSATLSVLGSRLLIIERFLWTEKEGEWALEEIIDVRVGRPADQEAEELLICTIPKADEPFNYLCGSDDPQRAVQVGFLTGRDRAELEWVAAVLRSAVRSRNRQEQGPRPV